MANENKAAKNDTVGLFLQAMGKLTLIPCLIWVKTDIYAPGSLSNGEWTLWGGRKGVMACEWLPWLGGAVIWLPWQMLWPCRLPRPSPCRPPCQRWQGGRGRRGHGESVVCWLLRFFSLRHCSLYDWNNFFLLHCYERSAVSQGVHYIGFYLRLYTHPLVVPLPEDLPQETVIICDPFQYVFHEVKKEVDRLRWSALNLILHCSKLRNMTRITWKSLLLCYGSCYVLIASFRGLSS